MQEVSHCSTLRTRLRQKNFIPTKRVQIMITALRITLFFIGFVLVLSTVKELNLQILIACIGMLLIYVSSDAKFFKLKD